MFDYQDIEDDHNREVVQEFVESDEELQKQIIEFTKENGTFVFPIKNEYIRDRYVDKHISLALLFSREGDVIKVQFSHMHNHHVHINL